MNLQSEISPELWEKVGRSYEGKNYTNSINDAIRYLFDVIKEKSGVEDDGVALIGQAFGGTLPKLQLNKLQTESEKMEQKGFQDIFRGIYSGIRNPRSHEGRTDSLENAEAIICFVNYLLSTINHAKQPFTVEEWIARVFDEYFVVNSEYAKELVAEIPERKRYDTLINLYQQRDFNKSLIMKIVFNELYNSLEEPQVNQFLRLVSNELRSIRDGQDLRIHLVILKSEFWPKLDKIVRMRLEQMIFNNIQLGAVEAREGDDFETIYVCTGGGLGTWSTEFIPYFMNKEEIAWALWNRISHSLGQSYVAQYFLKTLPLIVPESQRRHFIDAICLAIIKTKGVTLLAKNIRPSSELLSTVWQNEIMEKLKEKDQDLYNQMFGYELRDEDIPF